MKREVSCTSTQFLLAMAHIIVEESKKAVPPLDEEDSLASSPARVVRLNVGGVEFQTMSSTLTGWNNQRNNFFSALLETTRSKKGKKKEEEEEEPPPPPVFIDRDPDCFRVILNYLRTGHLSAAAVPAVAGGLEQLRVELAFYGVPEPVEWAEPFQQWARGHPGELRVIEFYDVRVMGALVRVWDKTWKGPCESFTTVARDVSTARAVLINEMGKLGWELKFMDPDGYYHLQRRP